MIRLAIVASLTLGNLGESLAPSRRVDGPDAVAWPHAADTSPSQAGAAEAATERSAPSHPPPPAAARPETGRVLRVAIGLDPSAPGSRKERALVDGLMHASRAARGPSANARRLRVGGPSARDVCRDGRDDLVILVGYLGDRPEPVVLGYDCALDLPLAVRSAGAVTEPGLIPSLWDEHEAHLRDGVKERRRRGRLGVNARVGIAAGVAIAVVGVAVGLLVANALREEVVVLKVGP